MFQAPKPIGLSQTGLRPNKNKASRKGGMEGETGSTFGSGLLEAVDSETMPMMDEKQVEQQLFAEALSDDDDLDVNDGCVTLMLRLMGLMCDNQHRELQDYMREQGDNFLSCDLVSETTTFLGFVYSNINPRNVQLVDELMQALLEFVSV